MPTDDRSGYERLAALGPFFAVRHDVEPDRWRPLHDLLDGPALDERVTHTRRVLSQMSGMEVEPRVAASTMSLGVFARLISPVLGAVVLGVRLPRPSFGDVLWQPTDGGPWPLALTGPPAVPDLEGVITDVVVPLADVIADRHVLSRQVLYGNAASAVFGAVGMIGSARYDLSTAARDLAVALLDGPLKDAGQVGGGFVRSSCCLYYRIPGGGYCGDCVLAYR